MIINNNVQAIAGAYAMNQSAGTRRSVGAQKPQEFKDEVNISTQGQSFSAMMKELKDTPDVRMDKVAFFKNAIAGGNYNVSGEDIAEKMLSARF